MPVIQYKCTYCEFTSLDKEEVELHEQEHIMELPVTYVKQDNKIIEALIQVSREVNGIQFILISGTENRKFARKFILSYDNLTELNSLLTNDKE